MRGREGRGQMASIWWWRIRQTSSRQRTIYSHFTSINSYNYKTSSCLDLTCVDEEGQVLLDFLTEAPFFCNDGVRKYQQTICSLTVRLKQMLSCARARARTHTHTHTHTPTFSREHTLCSIKSGENPIKTELKYRSLMGNKCVFGSYKQPRGQPKTTNLQFRETRVNKKQ